MDTVFLYQLLRHLYGELWVRLIVVFDDTNRTPGDFVTNLFQIQVIALLYVH